MKRNFLLIFFILSSYNSKSQTFLPRFENLGVNDGLSHSSVYTIFQDQKGFMWFGTPNGLCRFDGSSLKSFQFKGTGKSGIANNFVRGSLLEDKQGNIWYSNESGIYKWDALSESVEFVWESEKNGFNNSEIRAVYIDSENSLWLLALQTGILKFDTRSKKMSVFPFSLKIDYSSLNYVFASVDPNGNLCMKIGRSIAPIFTFNTKSHAFSITHSVHPPNAVLFSRREKLLVYSDKFKLYKNDDTLATATVSLKKDANLNFKSGIKDSYGRWWFATTGAGLVSYDEKSGQVIQLQHDNLKLKSLPFNIITCLYIDRSNNLWVGTDGGGLARLNLKQPKFNLFPQSIGDYPVLKDYFTKCFYEDERGRIWFGTHSNGLNIYDPQTQKLINYQNDPRKKFSLPGNIVAAIFPDRDKNIWIGTNNGLAIFKEGSNMFFPVQVKNISHKNLLDNGSFVFKVRQAKNGDIYCASTFGLIKIKKNKDGIFIGARIEQKYLMSASTDVLEMDDGKIYICRPTFGLLQVKPNGEDLDSLNNFFPGIDLRSISKDERNKDYLWISTGIGLIHFNTVSYTFKVYNKIDGLGDNYVYGELQDSTGNLWISTNKGLSYFKRSKNKFENYSHLDGLQSNEFNTQAFYKSASGNFYFGGINGFNWFKSGTKSEEKTKPFAAITSIEINNIPFLKDSNYLASSTISVPYNRNYFNFQFAALDYTRPEANKVQYQLEGWDNDEITTFNKSARYANLPPGRYTLKVKASNAEGTWSDEQKLQIIINAPYWKTGLFQMLFILILLILVIYATYILARQKVNRKMQLLEKQIAVDAERQRISTDMHDEIGSGITRIALISELMQIKQHTKSDLMDEIKSISTSAHKLVETMSEIIWALNPQNDTLENLLAYIREQSYQHFEPFDLQFDIAFPDEVPFVKLTNQERRNLFLATKEILNNALKHSDATVISLSFHVNKNQLCFSVSDNGIGIDQHKTREGSNGIRNLKKRMNDIKGKIEWVPLTPGTLVNYSMALKTTTTISTFIAVF